jgi:HD-GYP domain-containing protein (c-di-GMP phosphodiesterase class II)
MTLCEVAEVLADRLGLPADVHRHFYYLTERYDGAGALARSHGDDIPLGLRIALVARDASYLQLVGGLAHVRTAMRDRAGNAHDPEVAAVLIRNASEVLVSPDDGSSWDTVLDLEPGPYLTLDENRLDRALAAMGDFGDLVCPLLSGHSSGVARLAEQAARQLGMDEPDATVVRRAGLVQDIGRAAVRPRVWARDGALSPDEREQVRLHSYHSERILSRSTRLRELATLAGCHHERLDGSGYHKGLTAAMLPVSARLLAAADVFRALTQPRPHRPAQTEQAAASVLTEEAKAHRLDGDAVAAVLAAAGESLSGPVPRPGGLTDREAQVVGLVARGLATKQVARALSISPKTADHHLQNAYRKIGVSSRAAVSLYAMEHGLVAWGELPMGGRATHS